MEDYTKFVQVNKFYFLDGVKCTAALMSLINVVIFSKSGMRHHPILQYLLAMSLADAVYTLSMALGVPFSNWCSWLHENNNDQNIDFIVCYYSAWHYILVSEYFTSCMALFNILVEIHITRLRIKLISREARNNETEHRPWIVCMLISLASFAAYTPVLFMNEVISVETRNETMDTVHKDYFNVRSQFGQSSNATFFEQFLVITRICLISVVLTVVNAVASVKYTAFYKRKSAMKEIIRGYIFLIIAFL
jgi:hypothetical protein